MRKNISGHLILLMSSFFLVWLCPDCYSISPRDFPPWIPGQKTSAHTKEIKLPPPEYKGRVSVEEAIFRRRSVRSFRAEPLTIKEVSQLLWAAGGKNIDGVTGATRTYPSAGGIYPLEIYLVCGDVEGLPSGIYRYRWRDHSISLVKSGDFRRSLTRAALGQRMIAQAPASFVFTALYSRTVMAYGKRGRVRYVPMDVGGAGENLHLQAVALGLGTVIIGAFRDRSVKKILEIEDEEPLYIMPVGRPRRKID
jgi:SagB-type dehydrogenase family enzyme